MNAFKLYLDMQENTKKIVNLVTLSLLACLCSTGTLAQIHPAEGSLLHYRLIGFSVPHVPNTSTYSIEIAEGTYNTENTFEAAKPRKYNAAKPRMIIKVQSWGSQYTWRFITEGADKLPVPGNLFHFGTGMQTAVDTQNTKMKVLVKAARYNDASIFCDISRALYDIQGNAIWYLPDLPGIINQLDEVRDLKLSRRGTITFAANNMAYEIDYEGAVLWSAPNDGKVSGGPAEGYHHEITILSNNNYMVLGNEHLTAKIPNGDSNIAIVPTGGPKGGKAISYGTIIEYDTNSNIIWSWKSSGYFKQNAQLQNRIDKKQFDIHENAFFFDEQKKNIYVSFKNLSQVLKIRYPEGRVIAVYGNTTDMAMPLNSPFCHQHSCKISQKGLLYLFNNNICHPDATPTVVMMQEPPNGDAPLKKIWEYTYPYKDDFTDKRRVEGTSGGNVIEMPGGEMFVSMCSPYGNMFIVNKEKKLLWDAILEKWQPEEKKWYPISSYRASIISNKKDLEHLIWNEELNSN
jgi:hypothetical protein